MNRGRWSSDSSSARRDRLADFAHPIELYDFGVADDGTFYTSLSCSGMDCDRSSRVRSIAAARVVPLMISVRIPREAHEKG